MQMTVSDLVDSRYPEIMIACSSQRRVYKERKEAYRAELQQRADNNQLDYEQERDKWLATAQDNEAGANLEG